MNHVNNIIRPIKRIWNTMTQHAEHTGSRPEGRPSDPDQFIENLNYTLFDLSHSVLTTRNLESLYKRVHAALGRLMALPNFYIARIDETSNTIQFEYFADEYDQDYPLARQPDGTGSLTDEVIQKRQPLLLKENMLLERAKNSQMKGTLPKVWLGAPIIVQDTVVGVVAIQDYEDADRFHRKHLEILTCTADQLAMAIERKQLLERLAENQKNLTAIMKNTRTVFLVMDPNGTLLSACPPHRFTDIETGSSIFENTHPDDVEALMAGFRGIDPEMEALRQLRLKKKNGDYHFLKGRFNILRNPDGGMEKILFVGELRPDESGKLPTHSELDTFLTVTDGMAHDFNNLIAGIMGNLDLLNLETENFSDNQKACIRHALKAAKQTAELVRQLQSLTRPADVPRSDIDLYEPARDAFQFLESVTNPAIQKRLDIEPGRYLVNGYPNELSQVFINLGLNAVLAIEEKGIAPDDFIRVHVTQESTAVSPLDHIQILFQDSGCGMSSAVKEKVFDPMFSGWQSAGGRGLGLSLVNYIIAKRHNGTIEIETREGSGTRCFISLPGTRYEPASPAPRPKSLSPEGKTILVIEDEDMVRDMTVKSLTSFGYQTLTAENGKKAVDIFKANHTGIDAVLLDVIMPEMSGTEAFRQILEIDPMVKVVIASGHITNQDQRKMFSKAKAYLDKPFQIMELKRIMEDILR